MSQSPTWSASAIVSGDTTSSAADAATVSADTPVKRESRYPRLSPLQAAAATAVIFTSLVVLAGMTGVFSLHGSDEPAPLGAASTSPLRSAGGPVPLPGALSPSEPTDMITEVDNPPASLRSAQGVTGDTPKEGPGFIANAAPSNAAGNPGNAAAARAVPIIPAPQMAAAAPSTTQRSTRRAVPHREHQHRAHQGKTREQVIEELMQAKRDGSYRALQENYR